ncbi:hypothetical protein COW81_00830 [Candidatus Campbellbacteria bacterium CG22_combo_CG10-13_8_21_14_all_36_13]|uniref:Penicillin-binding protein 2 n=1 Tax=Candidatus Campbellbacteria bacterium CG22_combo_CG10-13_8_21_14_all_36_13 TaxID=1974529 RepID=A0A2H0E0G5_9BACT|nr:MAG: hypothetical protein COW81_00830 [Candidatus Campbellbacteria bacterium CG22_combo_CG10-13_8_21_14_all_36_13]
MNRWKRKRRYKDIDPDEIFLDSRNAPKFDRDQLEGRLERPINKFAPKYILFIFVFIALIFSGKLFLLQIKDGLAYTERSENNHLRMEVIFADRGVVYDRNGVELVWNEHNEDGEYSLRKYNTVGGLSHLLGYLSYPKKDDKGFYYETKYTAKDGIEKSFTEKLDGKNGTRIREQNVSGDIVSESTTRMPLAGKDLILSIDSKVQHNLYEFIKDLANRVGFEGGAGVIMDIYTGEVIALTSFPEYSSQVLTDGKDSEKIQGYITRDDNPFLNRATEGLYTPGSIVKPYVAVGALNEHLITPEKKILSTGSITIKNPYNPELSSVFNDWKAHGLVNVKDALAVSSNVYFYEVGGGFENQKGLGITLLEKYIRAFGIGEKTNIIGIDDVDGVVPNPKWKADNFDGEEWRLGDTYHTAIGQYGFQVTPIQMARAVAAVANDGILVTPKLTIDQKTDSKNLSIDVDKNVMRVVRDGMRQGVTSGIAQGLNLSYVKVAAKTGTAELGSRKQYVNSWITGFFPYDNPRYSFAVVMEKGPQSNLTGAVFVMRNLFEWMKLEAPEYLN